MHLNDPLPYSLTDEANFDISMQSIITPWWQNKTDGFLRGTDKKSLYWCQLTNPSHTKAIVVVNGRIESCQKYQELFYDLHQQGYDIFSFDHRGQGQSDKLTHDSDIGHVIEFDDYVQDMHSMVESFDLSRYQASYLLGHSMGGAIVTRYLQTHSKHPFTAVALSAPMFGIHIEWYLRPIARLLSQVLTEVNSKPIYAPGHRAYYVKPFENNPLTHSAVRYTWFRHLYEEQPHLQIGGPSTRWVWQSLMATKQCIQQTRQITVPLLVLQAEDDKVVSNSHQQRFIQKLQRTNRAARLISMPQSRHEILFEHDKVRQLALQAILNFFHQNK